MAPSFIVNIVDEFKRLAGIPGGFPKCLEFSAQMSSDGSITAEVRGIDLAIAGGVRTVDCWMMAFIDKLDSYHPDHAVRHLRVELDVRPKASDIESFRRRLSYLALNNDWNATLAVENRAENLYRTWEALLERPSTEIVRPDMNERQDNQDTNGKIEKNFQTWLAGERRSDNERLCVLGKDFIFGKGRNPKVLREFPTGAFEQIVSRDSRLLPTYLVDLVTVNRKSELALIELKINDEKLEVLSQSLDYALFFSCYADRLSGFLSEQLGVVVTCDTPIVCYLVNTHFHARFSTIASYFAPRTNKVPFTFRQVLLGSSANIEAKNSKDKTHASNRS